jgi:hypothetical protein
VMIWVGRHDQRIPRTGVDEELAHLRAI